MLDMKNVLKIAGTAVIALFVATAIPCLAGDSAVLRNGFSIRHERRQVIGTITRLFVDGDDASFVDIPTIEIDHFETAPDEPMAQLPAAQLKMRTSEKAGEHPLALNE